MVSLATAKGDPEKLIWDELDRVPAGMLGIEGSGMDLQPMSPNLDIPTKSIWFFTRRSSDLAQAISAGARAVFCVVGKDHDFHLTMKGPITVDKDPRRVEEYWNSVVEAWYQEGQNDPDLTLLHFRPSECSLWASTGNVLTFGWEIAKANFDPEKEPDVGVHKHIEFV